MGVARPSVATRVAGYSRELFQDFCMGLGCSALPVTLDQALITLSLSFLIWKMGQLVFLNSENMLTVFLCTHHIWCSGMGVEETWSCSRGRAPGTAKLRCLSSLPLGPAPNLCSGPPVAHLGILQDLSCWVAGFLAGYRSKASIHR